MEKEEERDDRRKTGRGNGTKSSGCGGEGSLGSNLRDLGFGGGAMRRSGGGSEEEEETWD